MVYIKNVDGVLMDMTPEEIEAVQAAAKQSELEAIKERCYFSRLERDSRLAASDLAVIRTLESGTAVSPAWVAYRQALRDVPQQAGFPDSIQWPVKPE